MDPYAYTHISGTPIRVRGIILNHTHMGYPIRVWARYTHMGQNNYIDPSLYSLSYCSIDDAYRMINKLRPGTLLSKIDLKDAFRLIPVRSADLNLLGIHWKHAELLYIDTCLPFGTLPL